MEEYESYIQYITEICNSALEEIEKKSLLKCSIQGYLAHLPYIKDVEDLPALKGKVENCIQKLLDYSVEKGYVSNEVKGLDFQHYKWQ